MTGHTGFKGGWLSLWLEQLGAQVFGFGLPPVSATSFYELVEVGCGLAERFGDIREREAVVDAVAWAKPQVVFHLAAQPLVLPSYTHPAATYEVNVGGTVNLLEAVRKVGGAEAVICVTSDKCYAPAAGKVFREGDPLGGEDPYSTSKAAAELVVSGYRAAFRAAGSGPRLATARAGNVFGGGDFSPHRLVPDLLLGALSGTPVRVRCPEAVRPWQHVLCPLLGYLVLAERLCGEAEFEGAWNFGPDPREAIPAGALAQEIASRWPGALELELGEGNQGLEVPYLSLDSTKAQERLGWQPPLSLVEGVEATVAWYRALREGRSLRALTLHQIEAVGQGVPQPGGRLVPPSVR